MRKTKWIAIAAFGLLVTGQTAFSQGPAIAYPSSNWSYVDHSSTFAEGAARGQAAVLTAVGDLTYMDSLAAVNYQEAYKRAIENSVAITKAYFEKREIREEFMRKYGPKPFVGEARKRAIEAYMPRRLSASEYNPATGAIAWPHILRQDRYLPLKEQIDSVFAERSVENSGNGSVTHRKISQLCDMLGMLLRENISTVTPDQYIAAKEFLRSVELEARTAMVAKENIQVQPVNEAAAQQVPGEVAVGAENSEKAG